MLHGASLLPKLLLHLHLHNLTHHSFLVRYFSSSPNPKRLYNSISLDYFDHLLQRCTHNAFVHQPKQIHGQIIVTASYNSAFLAARLISVYSKFGLLNYAKRVFDTTPIDCLNNVLLWNSILRANVSHEKYSEALELYCKMRNVNILPDNFSLPLIIRACANLGGVKLCDIVHCHVAQTGCQYHLHVANGLLAMYGKIGRFETARLLFDRMPVRNIISWNTIVSGFSLDFDCDRALEMFLRMESEGWEPNSVTWTSLLKSFARCGRGKETWELYTLMKRKGSEATAELLAVVISVCADKKSFDKGKMIHDHVVKGGFESYSIVKNSLICVYGKNGAVNEAEYLFSLLEAKTIVSWNAIISSYAESGLCDEAYGTFLQLEKIDGHPSLRPDVISWSAVIGGFSSKGRFEESLEIFRRMQLAKIVANSVVVSSVMMACAELSALNLGREIHAYVMRGQMDCNTLVGNGLINMYMKCGALKEANLVFTRTERKDLFTWNTMIAGCGIHGLGGDALRTFNHMINEGFEPDEYTFVSVLSACSHAGLVAQGRQYFDLMRREYSIEPQVEHYACMVDLLGRAGLLQEASDIIKNMPIEPNAYVWGALLNSCKMYKNTDVAEETAAEIFSLNSETSGSLMLLSNLYAASGRWEDSARVRHSVKTTGLKKVPGQSWIEVKNKGHMFSAGKASATGLEDINRILDTLGLQMKIEGYPPGKSFISDGSDEETVQHSNYDEQLLCESW